jgi:hypothetical protein
MRDKIKLTQQLLSALPPDNQISFDDAYNSWWHTKKPNSGLRLTKEGYQVFCNDLKITEYVFESTKPFKLKDLLLLDQRLTSPYWLGGKKNISISFFGSKEAMLIQLYGDLEKFLKNYIQ